MNKGNGMLFKFGKTIVEITGDHPVVDLVLDELSNSQVESALTPDIQFFLSDEPLPKIDDKVRVVGPVFALPDRVWIHFDNIGYRVFIVGWEEDLKVQVQVLPLRKRKFIPLWVYKWRNWTFISPLEQRAYSFINGILESILLFFGGDTGLLHASAIERNGKAVLFPSTGGVGKTTLSLLLVSQYGFNYISDDISLISKEGFVFFYPRKIMMYPYSLQGYEDLEKRFLSSRSFIDRLHWFWRKYRHGLKGGRRRVGALELYGNRVAREAEIQRVYFLARYPGDSFKLENVKPEAVAVTSSHVIFAEYCYYVNYLHYWEATMYSPVTIELVQKRLTEIYISALEKSDNYVLYIPAKASPQDLVGYMVNRLDGDAKG